MKYNIGDIVILKTDPEQKVRLVTGILIRINSNLYYLSHSTDETLHYEFEISKEVNEIFKLMNQ
jgi:hypothetical protein